MHPSAIISPQKEKQNDFRKCKIYFQLQIIVITAMVMNSSKKKKKQKKRKKEKIKRNHATISTVRASCKLRLQNGLLSAHALEN